LQAKGLAIDQKKAKKHETELPKISIITPVYNNAPYIEHCIKSVLNQDYPHLEYIIIDGGSTDGTVELIEKYADRLAYFESKKDRGQTHALNKGFAHATGDIFAWLNADEQYLPGTLSKVGRTFASHSELDFFYGNRIIVNRDLVEIGRKKWVSIHPKWRLLCIGRVLPSDASFWKATIHRKTGELDEKHFPRFGMDVDWFLRLSLSIKKWKHADNYLSMYMERPDRLSQIGKSSKSNLAAENHYLARKLLFKYCSHSKSKIWIGYLIASAWNKLNKYILSIN
jgi:glycosyltransferase involved in cell wall biosynthesis